MAQIKLNVNRDSRDLPDSVYHKIYQISNGLEIIPKDDDFPLPWEAGCYIEDGLFIIDGDLGQQGSHRGWAKTAIPLDKVSNYIEIYVTPNENSEYVGDEGEAEEKLRDIFTEYKWL